MQIELGRMDLTIQDLKEDEIDIALSCGLSFNPKTKRWDSVFINSSKFKYFINEKGLITLPLGNIGNLELRNLNITSTHNFPIKIDSHLNVENNKLTELKNFPTFVYGSINISNNKLTSLSDLKLDYPCKNFNCSNNKLTDLVGSPEVVYEFNCSDNPIVSLKGLPKFSTTNHSNKGFLLIAKNIRIKNYNYITKCTLNCSSIYKISDIEEEFTNGNTEDVYGNIIETGYVSNMSELEYYYALSSYIIKNKKEEAIDEIWWCDEIKLKLNDLFKSIKTINKYNL